jgi:hypothetical protein
LVVIVYPLSYAPVVRWKATAIDANRFKGGPSYTSYIVIHSIDSSTLPAYRPVDWLIDNTPLDRPLFAWARALGVGTEFEYSKAARTGFISRSVIPPQPAGGIFAR